MEPNISPPSSKDIETGIDRLADEICSKHATTTDLAIFGVANGGIPLADLLHRKIELNLGGDIPIGTVDISFHRDDIAHNPIPKDTDPTEVPIDIDGANILLVDDVIYTGRSVRAAVNELFDLGRPSTIELAVLYDRGGRKLPIQPDYRAFYHEHSASYLVEVALDVGQPINHAITISKET